MIARRVRQRVGDLLEGAFGGAQVVADLGQTSKNHGTQLTALDLPNRTESMFVEESQRVADALAGGGKEMLALLPGKHLLSILSPVLGMSDWSKLSGLIIRALDRTPAENESLLSLGAKIETALLHYLPPRSLAAAVPAPLSEGQIVTSPG